MDTAALLAQALGVAYSAGINLPATVAALGVAQRLGWVDTLPGGLDVLANPLVIGVAVVLLVIDFLIMLIPGIASVWETALTAIRPLAAVVLSVSTVYHLDTVYLVIAGLVGGGLALTTHGAKLGVRYAVDTSPEPVSNFAVNVAELSGILALCVAIWNHPYLSLTIAIVVLVLMILLIRSIWRGIQRAFRWGATPPDTSPPAL